MTTAAAVVVAAILAGCGRGCSCCHAVAAAAVAVGTTGRQCGTADGC